MTFKTFAVAGSIVVSALCAKPGSQKTVVLDSGHSPLKPGAISCRGIGEVQYNDSLTARIADSLRAHKTPVFVTREPSEEISLEGRTVRSGQQNGSAQISIHHDSCQPKYLRKTVYGSDSVFETVEPIRGFSLFVSKLNPQYKESLALAEAIGTELLKLGRKPTLHHAEPIAGENRTIIDSARGIYQFDDLRVLKGVKIPAVLIEFGVLVDRTDEAYVSNEENRKRFASAVSRGYGNWLRKSKPH